MQGSALNLVLVAQILLQALLGVSQGRVLCIPLGDCCSHHEDPATDPRVPHLEDDCDCHLHLPLPGDPKVVTRGQNRVDDLDPALTVAPAVGAITACDLDAMPPPHPRERPPDFFTGAQMIALRATHLRL